MDTGAIIGIVIGSIVLITIIFCLFARKSNDREFKIIEAGSHRTLVQKPTISELIWFSSLDILNILPRGR
jgi:hypothetical protein